MTTSNALVIEAPFYWREHGEHVRDAIMSFLQHRLMSDEQIGIVRDYLRMWIDAPVWMGPGIDELRAKIDELTSAAAIDLWLDLALDEGIDPL